MVLPYKTRRAALAIVNACMGVFWLWIGWRWMGRDLELCIGGVALGLGNITEGGVIWIKRRKSAPSA
jgi:hypothetical protein